MTFMIKEGHPALKHGGYSATRIFPAKMPPNLQSYIRH